jgi:hypothetical protein
MIDFATRAEDSKSSALFIRLRAPCLGSFNATPQSLAESGVARETPPMSDQPIRDRQPLSLPAGKRDGQIEIGCLEMLGQGHSVTGSLRSAGGRMRTHNAGAIAKDCNPAPVHCWHSQIVDHLNRRLRRRAHELCKHRRQMLVSALSECSYVPRLHCASRHCRTMRTPSPVAQDLRQLNPRVRVPIPNPV